MRQIRKTIQLSTVGGRPSFYKITNDVQKFIDENEIKEGLCVVYSGHTTCSVITQEYSRDETYAGLEFVQQDFVDVLDKIIPVCNKEGQYMHPGPLLTEFSASVGETKLQCLNTDAHLRSALVGRSITVGIIDGKLDMGDFGQIYFIDFDQTRPRNRRASVHIVGE